jgi:hypothetical protein
MFIDYSNVNNLIIQSKNVHGDKYDYSLLKPTSSRNKSKIICHIHGEFEQRIYLHILRKQGCPKCQGLKMNIDEFIEQSNIIHMNKYDYSEVKFLKKKSKIIIICKEHGRFEQLASSHLNGAGCPKCAGCSKSNKNEFIKKSLIIHKDKYDYSNIKYINAKTKVKIKCKIHGDFLQSPNKHLMGQGCPKCSVNSKGENKIEKILKKANIKFEIQKTFEDCLFKRKLKFDFYLLDYNVCLEFDGEQHFEKYRFEKDDKKLIVRKKRDSIKDIYCNENDIKLYRINYKENIEKKVRKILNDYKI